MNLSFQKFFFQLASFIAIVGILILGKFILIPLSVALLLSFILYPLASRFESWGMGNIVGAFLSLFIVFAVFGGVIFFFSSQILELSTGFVDFKDKVLRSFTDLTVFVNENVMFIQDLDKDELFSQMKSWLNDSSGMLIRKSINNTTAFLTGLFASVIFTFLILVYRKGLTHGFIAFAAEKNQKRVFSMLKSVQQVGQKYLLGMLFFVALIGLLNSIGLWVIGLENPFLFGYVGAVLGIIPYIGTISGAIIPITYAFVSHESAWMALSIAILYWVIQVVSDNLINPKIVGSTLKVNALAAILSLSLGAAIWGIAGMVLFLPFMAMLKVVCEEYEELKPVAMLIGEHNQQKTNSLGKKLEKWSDRVKKWYAGLKKSN